MYSIVGGEGVKGNKVRSMAFVYDLGPIGAQYRALHDLKSFNINFAASGLHCLEGGRQGGAGRWGGQMQRQQPAGGYTT